MASPTLLLHSGQNGLEGSCVNLSHAAIVVAQVKDAGGWVSGNRDCEKWPELRDM